MSKLFAYRCQQDRTTELSDRMFNRNIPDTALEPVYNYRPAHTRRTVMPIMDCRKVTNSLVYPTYNTTQFNPGTDTAPFSGFATAIDTESELFSVDKKLENCDKRSYYPNSSSDMFENDYLYKNSNRMKNSHNLLNKYEQFNPFNPNKCGLGRQLFSNHTRQQRLGIDLNKEKKENKNED